MALLFIIAPMSFVRSGWVDTTDKGYLRGAGEHSYYKGANYFSYRPDLPLSSAIHFNTESVMPASGATWATGFTARCLASGD